MCMRCFGLWTDTGGGPMFVLFYSTFIYPVGSLRDGHIIVPPTTYPPGSWSLLTGQ